MDLAGNLAKEDPGERLELMARMARLGLRVSKVFPALWAHQGTRVFLVKLDRKEILELQEILVQGEIQVNIYCLLFVLSY